MSEVMTVSGPVRSTELGATLMHEHLFLNLMAEYRSTGLLNDMSLMVEEVGHFRDAGGRTIIELTPAELTHGAAADPTGIVTGHPVTEFGSKSRTSASVQSISKLANASGLNIVLGTGHYRDPYLDRHWFDAHSVDKISEFMVRDLEEGIGDTDVRAGIIGEIGADKWYISALEERSFRAAARAHRQTNCAITTHAARWPVGIQQLDLLAEESVDPRRVIVGHCDSVHIPEYHEAIARRGAYVQFDLIRGQSEHEIAYAVSRIKGMIEKGYLRQVLMSHDVCTTAQLQSSGGCGYAYISTLFSDRLRSAGVADEQIREIMVENPRRALAGE